ncbi:hypothetical protein [Clostridium celatum]|uniref:Uncharacterized protein n=1 Tax=Clostridium celatum DSM 1785 TaxID=545697 RepID=L1QGF0_9CLOT|nr:hypothetical protein [Clostridium celatum]EKY27016.1 hypothetical protein HMPREF0216_01619 [Clostridium celatum DSM 1785]
MAKILTFKNLDNKSLDIERLKSRYFNLKENNSELKKIKKYEEKILFELLQLRGNYTMVDAAFEIAEILDYDVNTVLETFIMLQRIEIRGESLEIDERINIKVDLSKKGLKPIEIIAFFKKFYFKTYKFEYKVNYAKDINQVKKLHVNYNDDEILEAIETFITDYNIRYENRKYPFPTIGAFCSWGIERSYSENSSKKAIYYDRYKDKDDDKEFTLF